MAIALTNLSCRSFMVVSHEAIGGSRTMNITALAVWRGRYLNRKILTKIRILYVFNFTKGDGLHPDFKRSGCELYESKSWAWMIRKAIEKRRDNVVRKVCGYIFTTSKAYAKPAKPSEMWSERMCDESGFLVVPIGEYVGITCRLDILSCDS